MKKLLFVLALGAFAACGNGNNDTATSDTATSTVDTAATAPMTADTATAPMVDTTKKDSTK